jgi:hypothetical protein
MLGLAPLGELLRARRACGVLACLTFPWLAACVEEPPPQVPTQAVHGYAQPAWPYGGDGLAAPPPPVFPFSPPPAATQAPAATAACLDSRRGTAHRFTGRLELHPDGSGNLRLVLDRPVCFEGGEFSRGTTDSIVVQGDASAAASLLGRQVEARGVSADLPPSSGRTYVFQLGSVALTSSR